MNIIDISCRFNHLNPHKKSFKRVQTIKHIYIHIYEFMFIRHT